MITIKSLSIDLSLVLFLLRLRHFVNDAIDVYRIAVDRFIVGDILPVAFEASCKDDYDAIDVERIDGDQIESNRIGSDRIESNRIESNRAF